MMAGWGVVTVRLLARLEREFLNIIIVRHLKRVSKSLQYCNFLSAEMEYPKENLHNSTDKEKYRSFSLYFTVLPLGTSTCTSPLQDITVACLGNEGDLCTARGSYLPGL